MTTGACIERPTLLVKCPSALVPSPPSLPLNPSLPSTPHLIYRYNLGTFRLSVEKFHFLENDIRVPFLARGPGVAPNSVSRAVVANIDIGSTILDLAGVTANLPATDGKSFAADLHLSAAANKSASAAGRDRVVIEYGSWGTGYVPRGPCNNSCGICEPELTQLVDAPSNTYTGMRIINSTHNIMCV